MQNNLIRLRKERGLSQEELADKLSVSRQAVSKWERGEALPDTDNLIRLAKLYNVSIDEIVGYSPEKDDSAAADGTDNGDANNDDIHFGTPDSGDATADNGQSDNTESADGFSDKKKKPQNEYAEFLSHGGENKDFYTKDGKHVRFESDGNQKRIVISDDDDDDDDDMDDDDYPKRRTRLTDVLDGVYVILTVIAFFVWGSVFDGWKIAWTLFITIPIFTSIVSCVRKRRVGKFNFPCFVAFIYLLFGMIFNIWHPLWVIFLLVPAFYPIARVIDSSIKEKERGNNK